MEKLIIQAGDLQVFRISPLIRGSLLLLYTALMVPLPVMAGVIKARGTDLALSPTLLAVAIGLGGVLLYGALAQRVEVDGEGISVGYPPWISGLFRSRWHLSWSEVQALKPRSTGQGGIVYYFIGPNQQAYLLPMRVAGFSRLLQWVETHTELDTQDIKPLAQPWMYGVLLLLTLLLLLVDIWTVATALYPGAGLPTAAGF
ncbi:MAG: hypothetical protein VKO01_05210 [Cyanobacteriota bacterium]|nr:hypothetical protein [Cyanobacteriota bacterium]